MCLQPCQSHACDAYCSFGHLKSNVYIQNNVFQIMTNKMQSLTVFFYLCKLLYMFRADPPPIIRSTQSCIYIIWYVSKRYCYLPLSWKRWNCVLCILLVIIWNILFWMYTLYMIVHFIHITCHA